MMRNHVRQIHKIESPVSGIHYMDKTSRYEQHIQSIMTTCFSGSAVTKKRLLRPKQEEKKIRCLKCSAEVKAITYYKRKHVFLHLREDTQWRWVYK